MLFRSETLYDKLKLTTSVTENLTCWLPTGKLRKFDSVWAIIDYFIEWRLEKYEYRRSLLIELIDGDITALNEKVRFIYFYLEHVNEFRNASKFELLTLLQENNFSDDLLDMKLWNLTKDKIEELENNVKSKQIQKEELQNITNVKMYSKELESI